MVLPHAYPDSKYLGCIMAFIWHVWLPFGIKKAFWVNCGMIKAVHNRYAGASNISQIAKTFWLQFGRNLAGHFGKVMVGLLGPKWPNLGKLKSHQKEAKLHPKLIVDFQNTAIIVPEEPQISP